MTIRHHVHVYRCNGCGRNEIRSRNVRRAEDVRREAAVQEPDAAVQAAVQEPDAAVQERQDVVHTPRSGTYGLNILAAILFNFMDRLPHRLNVASMGRIGLRISVGTVHNILYRIGMGLEPSSREILERVRKAYVLHIDETSLSLNGKLVWIWIFFNPETGDVYYAIRRSRGGDVLAEVLGGSWVGRIVCDGLSPYKKYRIQRCWAHIINEIKHIKDGNPGCPEAQIVLDRLREIHRIGLEATGSLQERRRVRNLLRKRVKRLIDAYGDIPALHDFLVKKLHNAEPNLFLYVLDPRVDSTNNAAERELREPVVHRKIRGAIRSAASMEWWGNLFTCVMTWRMRKMDVYEELAKCV